MEKLLVICGPTATGKTALGIFLAEKYNGEIISADSRQVYKGMNIGTGKDLPENSKFQYPVSSLEKSGIGFYEVGGIKIWGYDLASPKKGFSVSGYIISAQKIITDMHKRGKLPILVGGTGLYIKGLTNGIQTASIPMNSRLRKNFERKKAEELYENLAQLDPIKAAGLNSSDRHNPRRLIRALEVAYWKLDHTKGQKDLQKNKYNTLFLGLNAPKETLSEKIKQRIEKRMSQGMEKEIRDLLASGVNWNNQAMESLGYKQMKEYVRGEMKRDDALNQWYLSEKNYAKRQITWFKKDARINWFDVTMDNWRGEVDNMVRSWYYN